jgi:hypothetical protein
MGVDKVTPENTRNREVARNEKANAAHKIPNAYDYRNDSLDWHTAAASVANPG